MRQAGNGVERVEEKVRPKLGLERLQARDRQLSGTDFGASMKTQRVCDAHDHDVDGNFRAGEMEEVPGRRRWPKRTLAMPVEILL